MDEKDLAYVSAGDEEAITDASAVRFIALELRNIRRILVDLAYDPNCETVLDRVLSRIADNLETFADDNRGSVADYVATIADRMPP